MIVDCALYEKGVRQSGLFDIAEVPGTVANGHSFVWIGLYEPTEAEFSDAQKYFELHELAVEDSVSAHQRPKLEIYDESVFIVLKTARYLDEEETVDFGEIQIFIGPGFLVHVRHGMAAPMVDVRRDLERHPDRLAHGPSSVLHAIADRVVDSYEPVIAGLENDIRELEFQVFSEHGDNPVQRIYFLKREVLETTQALQPLLQPLEALAHNRVPYVHEDMEEYFRDVHDHLERMLAEVRTMDDLLNSILSANLTRVSIRQNEDMRKISAWVAIAAVPTMIAGIYGMNFEHMPELGSIFGYPMVLGLMFLVCSVMYRGFRRAGWL
ncbi:MAG: magnesium/cobalt transporter CorA [Acidimicrobiales bacterium]|nr:magnesium/cobalt transporter CorA [Acidimicrobiales bacterium]